MSADEEKEVAKEIERVQREAEERLAALRAKKDHNDAKSVLSDPMSLPHCYSVADKAAKKLVEFRKHQIEWFDGFLHEMDIHEGAVRAAKTAAAGGGLFSTILLFTPLAPFGAVGLVVSGAAGAATGVADFIANHVKNGDVQKHIDESKGAEEELKAAVEAINKHVREIEESLDISHEDANSVLLAILNYIKTAAGAGITITSGAVQIMTCAPAMMNIRQLVNLGVPIRHAAALIAATTTASEAAAVGLETGRVALDTSRAVTGEAVGIAAKSLAVLGAIISVADCVISWVTENPTKHGAKEARKSLKENLDKIKHYMENWAPYVFHGEITQD